jgi:hypothetical protein
VSGQRQAPAALYPRGKDPGTQWTGCWVGRRAGLDTEARVKNPLPLPGIEPELCSLQSDTALTELINITLRPALPPVDMLLI